MASYQEILTQIEELKQQAQDARKQELAGAISEIKRLMAEFGITLEDLGDKLQLIINGGVSPIGVSRRGQVGHGSEISS